MADDTENLTFTAFWCALDLAMVANGKEPLLWSEARRYWFHAKQAQESCSEEEAS